MIGPKQGFTLLEILIGITIFSMVIGMAYSSYNATFHIINSAESQTDTYAKARITLERMREDLESFYPGKELFFKGEEKSLGKHRADSLQFVSTAHIQLHPDSVAHGPVIIRYQAIEDPDSGTLHLYRTTLPATEELIEEEDTAEGGLLLCDNLTEIAFEYQNKDGELMQNWGQEDEEESSPVPPNMIMISLRFNSSDEDLPGTLFQTGIQLPVTIE